jgi:hypothetical protein
MANPAPATSASTPPASLGENDGASVVDRVFLSPRVLDQQAFTEFTTTLRGLIEQAAMSTQQLRGAAERSQRVIGDLSKAEASQQQQTAACVQALGEVDQRARLVQHVLEEAERLSGTFTKFESDAERITERKVTALESRLQSLLEQAQSRMGAMEQRIAAAAADVEARAQHARSQIEQTLTQRLERMEELVLRASVLTGRGTDADGGSGGTLGDLVRRAERLRDDAGFATRQLDSVRQQSEQARLILGESLNSASNLIDQAMAQQEALQTQLGEAVRHCRLVSQTLDQRVAELRRAVDQAVADATPRADAAASELRGTIGDAEQAAERAGAVIEAIDASASQLRGLLTQLEPWQGILLGRGSRDMPAPIRDIVHGMRREMARDLSSLAQAFRSIATRAEAAIDDAAMISLAGATPPVPVETSEARPVVVTGAASKPVVRVMPHPHIVTRLLAGSSGGEPFEGITH